jgi:hypothetical protein
VSAARAIASAQREGETRVLSLQELHRALEGAEGGRGGPLPTGVADAERP